jgi:hypothetical protein
VGVGVVVWVGGVVCGGMCCVWWCGCGCGGVGVGVVVWVWVWGVVGCGGGGVCVCVCVCVCVYGVLVTLAPARPRSPVHSLSRPLPITHAQLPSYFSPSQTN